MRWYRVAVPLELSCRAAGLVVESEQAGMTEIVDMQKDFLKELDKRPQRTDYCLNTKAMLEPRRPVPECRGGCSRASSG
jgi:hypothetical protein